MYIYIYNIYTYVYVYVYIYTYLVNSIWVAILFVSARPTCDPRLTPPFPPAYDTVKENWVPGLAESWMKNMNVTLW